MQAGLKHHRASPHEQDEGGLSDGVDEGDPSGCADVGAPSGCADEGDPSGCVDEGAEASSSACSTSQAA